MHSAGEKKVEEWWREEAKTQDRQGNEAVI